MTASATIDRPTVRHLSGVEVSAIVRRLLKAAFPATKFSVTTRTGSVNVRWTDGPTMQRVGAITGQFEGKSFDGSDDSTKYAGAFRFEGEMVSTYCYVFEVRDLSPRFVERVAAAVASRFGITTPAIVADWIKPTKEQEAECRRATGRDWGQMIWFAAGDHTVVTQSGERRLALVEA